jgi:CubicO group peptidase (beta-lactamase class C family)
VWVSYDDWIKYTIDKPMAQEPGTHFAYSSGATELLAYIFQKQTGQDIETYAEQYLFRPLGMTHHWTRSPSGLVDTEGGLFLNGADLAKVGYLYLHDGVWGRQRLLTHHGGDGEDLGGVSQCMTIERRREAETVTPVARP